MYWFERPSKSGDVCGPGGVGGGRTGSDGQGSTLIQIMSHDGDIVLAEAGNVRQTTHEIEVALHEYVLVMQLPNYSAGFSPRFPSCLQ